MATDSSSGTLPSSSRLTIDSSSSSARSKLNFLTSVWAFSAMLVFPGCAVASAIEMTVGASRRRVSRRRAHQGTDMGRDRFFQALKIITALEYRNNSASRGAIGEVHQFPRHPTEVFGFEIERSQGITMMRIESGRDDDELGAEFAQVGQDRVFESGAEFRAAIFRRERRVDDVIVVATFTAGAGAREQRHLMRRAIHYGL